MADTVHFAMSERYSPPKPSGWKVYESSANPPGYRDGTDQEYHNQVTLPSKSGFNGLPFGIPILNEHPSVIRKEITIQQAVEIVWRIKEIKIQEFSCSFSLSLVGKNSNLARSGEFSIGSYVPYVRKGILWGEQIESETDVAKSPGFEGFFTKDYATVSPLRLIDLVTVAHRGT